MGIVSTTIIFVISLLVGGLGIYVGARMILGRSTSYLHAVVTALIGAIVWGIVSLFVGWIPILGALLALIAWVGVINWRYPGGWGNAIVIGLIAWIASGVVLWLLALLNIVSAGALGVSGA
ncbi:hypothetical protein [Haladaptatus salinisoli]|uniref:hypothetical protein n=1 Tax=Haladaptatus salinisoli TaxID=2884876 RepID=UPI001D0BC339|nr:hypothetical protein [Haladaptatus salinisoli]